MKKIMEVKNSLIETGANMKSKLEIKALQVVNKLKEQEGNLLEYLESSVIGVVLLGIIIAALVALVTTVVIPRVGDAFEKAFSFGAK